MPAVRAVTLADPDPEAREQCAGLWNSRRANRLQTCASAAELLAASQLDAVIVASPTACHALDARLVLDAGLPLYLEKPIAANLEEAETLAALDQADGSRATMGFNYRFHPLHARARHLIRTGQLGAVTAARSHFTFAPRELPAWKHRRSTGGGVLLDLGSHHLDLLCHTLGQSPLAVRATITTRQTEADTAQLEIDFASGTRASCSYSFCGDRERDDIEWIGDRGRLMVDRYAPARFPILPPWGWIAFQLERYRSPWKEASFAKCLESWITANSLGAAPPASLADGLRALRIVDAAERSAAAAGATITL